jgi:predicted RNA binding protein YcfA (HicA-like mRNA interferase family)
MSKAEKLLAAIRNNPADVRFDDLVRLLKVLGFQHDRDNGSHQIYIHTRRPQSIPRVNIQPTHNGLAKVYQVKQVLSIVDSHNLEVKS